MNKFEKISAIRNEVAEYQSSGKLTTEQEKAFKVRLANVLLRNIDAADTGFDNVVARPLATPKPYLFNRRGFLSRLWENK